MQGASDRDDRGGEDFPWENETHCRVLSQEGSGEGGGVIHCISENHLYLLKARAKPGCGNLATGQKLALPEDESSEIAMILSRGRYRELSTSAQLSLVDVVKQILSDNPKPSLTFYNRSGNVSLKFHAFQLLPGVGPQKAKKMMQSRTSMGWFSFEEVDEACDIDSLQLIAERLVEELEDPKMIPSLIQNVVRVAEV
jgi:predicted nucleic acid-binding OB-fold protein